MAWSKARRLADLMSTSAGIPTASIQDDAITSAKIADDAVVTASIADDAITSALIADDAVVAAAIADNAVVTASIADDAVTSAKTTGVITNPNILINGSMEVIQRQPPSASSTVTGYKTVDRWNANWGGTSAGITQAQVALTSGGPYDEGHRYVFKCTNTSNTTAADKWFYIRQGLEAKIMRNCGWQYNSTSSYITYSFWAKSSLAGTYYVFMYSADGTPQSFRKSFTLSAATWTKVSVTIPGAANITINDDTGLGCNLDIHVDRGTDYTGSGGIADNAWGQHSSATGTADMAQAWQNTSSATFEVTGCKLELGQSATPYDHLSFDKELERCQRYYAKSYIYTERPGGAAYYPNAGSYAGTYMGCENIDSLNSHSAYGQRINWNIPLPVPMANHAQTLTIINPYNGDTGKIMQSGGGASYTATLWQWSEKRPNLYGTVSGNSYGNVNGGDAYRYHWTAEGELG